MSRIGLARLGTAAAVAGLNVAAPGGRFRRSVRVELATGAFATGLEILPGTRLAPIFSAREVEALPVGALERAMLTQGNAGLEMALPTARRIARIRLGSFEAGDLVAAFRFDGQAVSERAVVTAEHGQAGAPLGVTDRKLILRRVRDGVPQSLGPAAIASVMIGYEPSNPRLGIDLPADGAGAEFLAGDPASMIADARGAAGGAALAEALSARIRRFADERQAPLPNPLVFDLVLEADQPCGAGLRIFDLGYVLSLRGFADGADKQRLRFPGGRQVVERVELALPANAVFLSAPVAISEPPGPPGQQGAVPGPEASIAAAASDAVMVRPGDLVASRVALAEARVVTGAQARLAAVEEASVVASLWENGEGGLPDRKLAESAAVPLRSGQAMLIPFAFSAPTALPAGPAWLVFSMERGRAALALDDSADGAVAVHGGQNFAIPAAAAGRGGAAALVCIAPAGDPGGNGDLAVTVAGAAVPLRREGGAGAFEADLAPRLNALPRPRPERIAIEIASQRKSVVTVDPPLFRYEEAP